MYKAPATVVSSLLPSPPWSVFRSSASQGGRGKRDGGNSCISDQHPTTQVKHHPYPHTCVLRSASHPLFSGESGLWCAAAQPPVSATETSTTSTLSHMTGVCHRDKHSESDAWSLPQKQAQWIIQLESATETSTLNHMTGVCHRNKHSESDDWSLPQKQAQWIIRLESVTEISTMNQMTGVCHRNKHNKPSESYDWSLPHKNTVNHMTGICHKNKHGESYDWSLPQKQAQRIRWLESATETSTENQMTGVCHRNQQSEIIWLESATETSTVNQMTGVALTQLERQPEQWSFVSL